MQSLLDVYQQLFGVLRSPGESMGALKITMQQFYRPDGDSTQRRGVLADIELPSITTHLDVGEADLDYPLPFDKSRRDRLQAIRRRHSGHLRSASQALRAAGAELREVPKGRPQHRPLQRAEGQEVRHPERGEIPQGAEPN